VTPPGAHGAGCGSPGVYAEASTHPVCLRIIQSHECPNGPDLYLDSLFPKYPQNICLLEDQMDGNPFFIFMPFFWPIDSPDRFRTN